MVTLDKLRYTKCPTCGAAIKSQCQHDLHTCGQWNEEMEFQCGCTIQWSPNYGREVERTACPRLPAAVEKKKKRNDAKEDLVKYIAKLDVDDDYKDRLRREVETLYVPS